VDDEEVVLQAMGEFLRRLGYNCEVAMDPIEAFEILHMHPFDLVISDITMPEMDGIQFMQKAKRSKNWRIDHG